MTQHYFLNSSTKNETIFNNFYQATPS